MKPQAGLRRALFLRRVGVSGWAGMGGVWVWVFASGWFWDGAAFEWSCGTLHNAAWGCQVGFWVEFGVLWVWAGFFAGGYCSRVWGGREGGQLRCGKFWGVWGWEGGLGLGEGLGGGWGFWGDGVFLGGAVQRGRALGGQGGRFGEGGRGWLGGGGLLWWGGLVLCGFFFFCGGVRMGFL